MDHFLIDVQNPGRYYALFYFLAFLTGLILLIREGHQRKFPIVPWLLVITTAFLFFMIGSQLIRFTLQDWSHVFRLEKLDRTPGRSVLGGILFVVPGLIIAKYALRFQYSIMDAFAWVWPIGAIIQRIGCLIAGCCFGRVTTVPWGIHYGAVSHAFQEHVHENFLPPNASSSLAVHPAQLYEIIGCLLILLVLALVKKYIKAPGNLFLTTLLLYAHVRFITEFFRVSTSGNTMMGFTLVQACIVFLVPLLAFIILAREGRTQTDPDEKRQPCVGFHYVLYFVFIISLFLFSSRWLSSLEVVTLNLVLLPMLAFASLQIYKSITVPKMRWVTAGLMGGSILMMSQTLPERSTSDSTKLSYNVFSLGTSFGSSKFVRENHDCSGTGLPDTYVDNFYKANAIGISRVVQQNNGSAVQFGIDGFRGTHREEVNSVEKKDISITGVHPYFQYDANLLGFGFGFHVGTLTALKGHDFDTPERITSLRKLSFYPSLNFRVGYLKRFFGELKLAQQFPTNFPSLLFQANFGIGFGKENGGAFRIGTATYSGIFVSPSFPAGKNLIIEPYIGFLRGFSGNFQKESNFTGALSLRYKFNHKDRPLE
jgi:prolipoprotein diacylglyceryltransferase